MKKKFSKKNRKTMFIAEKLTVLLGRNKSNLPIYIFVSGVVFQRILSRNASEFIPKGIVLAGERCSVLFIRRLYVSSLCTKNPPINDTG